MFYTFYIAGDNATMEILITGYRIIIVYGLINHFNHSYRGQYEYRYDSDCSINASVKCKYTLVLLMFAHITKGETRNLAIRIVSTEYINANNAIYRRICLHENDVIFISTPARRHEVRLQYRRGIHINLLWRVLDQWFSIFSGPRPESAPPPSPRKSIATHAVFSFAQDKK